MNLSDTGLLLACVCLMSACQPPENKSSKSSDPPKLEKDIFKPDHLMRVDIEMATEDWDSLRHQVRPMVQVYRPNCMAQPFASPFVYFAASVTVDGEKMDNVGVRKKGFIGSGSEEKPSLKIKFDKFDSEQRFYGHKRLTLNNAAQQERSYVQQCLTYDFFRRAGLPAPRCSFAQVHVNGQKLGVYVHVESIKKPFVRRYWDDSGLLYEGTLSDFREGWTGTFQQKTRKSEQDKTAILGLTQALQADDSQLVAALQHYIDVDHFLLFWAAEVIVGHWDGYAGNLNNYYLYVDPQSQRIQFIPWGTDATFVSSKVPRFANLVPLHSVYANGVLTRRLYQNEETRARYHSTLNNLLDELWDEAYLQREAERMHGVFAPALLEEERGIHRSALDVVKNFIQRRKEMIRDEIEQEDTSWTLDPRPVLCGEDVGTFSAEFVTQWGTWPTYNALDTGSGTFGGEIDGQTLQAQQVGAAFGLEQNGYDAGKAVLMIPAVVPDSPVLFVYASISPELVVANTEVAIDGAKLAVQVGAFTGGGATEGLGYAYEGTLRFDLASQQEGQDVSGRVQGRLVSINNP